MARMSQSDGGHSATSGGEEEIDVDDAYLQLRPPAVREMLAFDIVPPFATFMKYRLH